jgi:hypothetical protein
MKPEAKPEAKTKGAAKGNKPESVDEDDEPYLTIDPFQSPPALLNPLTQDINSFQEQQVYLKKVRVSNEELAQKRMELEKAKAAQQRQFAKQRMVLEHGRALRTGESPSPSPPPSPELRDLERLPRSEFTSPYKGVYVDPAAAGPHTLHHNVAETLTYHGVGEPVRHAVALAMDETGVPHSTTIVNTIRVYVIQALQASSVPEVHIASVSDALETMLPALHPQVAAPRAIQSALTGALASFAARLHGCRAEESDRPQMSPTGFFRAYIFGPFRRLVLGCIVAKFCK